MNNKQMIPSNKDILSDVVDSHGGKDDTSVTKNNPFVKSEYFQKKYYHQFVKSIHVGPLGMTKG